MKPWKKLLLPLAACLAVAVLVLPLKDTLSGGAKMERATAAAAPAMDTASAESAPAEAAETPAAEAPAALYQEAPVEDADPQEYGADKKMGSYSGGSHAGKEIRGCGISLWAVVPGLWVLRSFVRHFSA